ncbi:MAG TPA: hypothetical protein VF880_21075, partial [Actinomycetes bacterium]
MAAALGGHQRGGEPLGRGGVDLEQGGARGGRQVVGLGRAEHGRGLGGAEGAQADPVAQVAVQAAQAALVEALG